MYQNASGKSIENQELQILRVFFAVHVEVSGGRGKCGDYGISKSSEDVCLWPPP